MLTILIISDEGEGYELAYRFAQEAQHVKYHRLRGKHEYRPTEAEPKPQVVDQYETHISTADLVIACGPFAGRIAAKVGASGRAVVGGLLTAELVAGSEISDAAIKLIGHPTGVRSGMSIKHCGFVRNGKLSTSWSHLSYNRMLDGDRGPIADSMGGVSWVSDEGVIDRVLPLIAAYNYTGFLQLEFNEASELVEVSARIDDAVLGFLSGCRGAKHQTLFNLARGQKLLMSRIAATVKLLSFDKVSNVELNAEAVKHFWRGDTDSYLGTVTASGDTVREARRRVYRTIRNIAPVELIYRNGIGLTLEERGGQHEDQDGRRSAS